MSEAQRSARADQCRGDQHHLALLAAAAVTDLFQQLAAAGGLVGDDEDPAGVVGDAGRLDAARLAPPGGPPDEADPDADQQGGEEHAPDRAGDQAQGDHEGRGGPDDDYEAKDIRLVTKRVVHGAIVARVTSYGQPT
jgi:hypothetical protein